MVGVVQPERSVLAASRDAVVSACTAVVDVLPLDTIHIQSPFASNFAPAACGGSTITLGIPADISAPTEDHLTVAQRIAVAGLGGIAAFGAMFAGSGFVKPMDPPSISHTLSGNDVLNGNAVDAFLGEGAARGRRTAPGTRNEQETKPTLFRDGMDPVDGRQVNTDWQAQRSPAQQDTTKGKRVRVFGQDVGGALEDDIPGVTWEKYAGTYNGQAYEIEYPKGWKVTKIFNGLAVLNPQDPTTVAVFQWRNGQGSMTPNGLIQTLLSEASAQNVRVVSSKPSGPQQTPIGPLYIVEAELTYTADGDNLKAQMTSAVANAPNSYVPFWNGNIVAAQTKVGPEAQRNMRILRHVTNSMAGK